MLATYGYLTATVIIFIPLSSITHFIPPLSNCLLADICNHTWIPECGEQDDDYRIFIDECDMWEYNCDYRRNFQITNYSICFIPRPPTPCPPIPPCPACPPCPTYEGPQIDDRRFGYGRARATFDVLKLKLPTYRYHTHHAPGRHSSSHKYMGIFFHSYRTTTLPFTGLRPIRTKGWRNPHRRRYTPEEGKKLTTRKTTKKTQTTKKKGKHVRRTRKNKRITKEVIRTGSTSIVRRPLNTVILKMFTGTLEGGKRLLKVVKGFATHLTTFDISDSDFLE